MEEWKKIQDFDNYSVSSFGCVKNDKTGLMLRGCPDKDGYLRICLYDNLKKRKYVSIHNLVATLFIENVNNYNQIDHIDRNVANNNKNNLRWCSHSQNQVNRNKFKKSKNNYLGVSKTKNNAFQARISVNNKRVHIGTYKTEEEGALAYNNYIIKNNLQEFYNLSII